MLEPLTALSLVAAVVQFVDFGSKLLLAGYGAYRSTEGTTEDNARLAKVHTELKSVAERLEQPSVSSALQPSADEIALQELAKDCKTLADKLLSVLSRLEVKGQGLPRAWDALRSAIRKALKAGELEKLQTALATIRSELAIRLLCIIRDQNSTLEVTIKRIGEESKLHQVANASLLEDAKTALLTAVQGLNDELKRNATVTSSIQSANYWAAQRVEDKIDLLSKQLDRLETKTRDAAKVNKILSSLLYPQIQTRHINITRAHRETFRWIFEGQKVSFRAWLEGASHDTDVFWVTGKPGSGKSTLMKFIADHEMTRTSLQHWAGGKHLTIASFYFWNPGSEMQKSQCGLLQSLLCQMLRELPDLIPLALPDRWSDDGFLLDHPHASPWTWEQLRQALTRTVEAAATSASANCFCFFIDGLDEFKASETLDHYTLAADLLKLAQWPAVKLCVSSRPWTVFRKQLGCLASNQQLVMEDLTEGDMKVYIHDTLVNDVRFSSRLESDPEVDRLVSTIQRNASGVFLWVYLVVRSLLDGLTNDDDISQLQERVDLLPSDLKQYFLRMLDGVDEAYHADAARLLLLRAQYRVVLNDVYNIPIDRRGPRLLLRTEPVPLSDVALKQQQRTGLRYVENWCKDLLTVGDWPDIEFTHRTVADFVVSDAYDLLNKRAGHDEGNREYAPYLTYCRLCLCALKGLDFACDGLEDLAMVVRQIICIAQEREAKSDAPLVDILDELDRVASLHLHNIPKDELKANGDHEIYHWTDAFYRLTPDSVKGVPPGLRIPISTSKPLWNDESDERSETDESDELLLETSHERFERMFKYDSFLWFAARCGMTFYVTAKLDNMSAHDRDRFMDDLCRATISYRSHLHRVHEVDVDTERRRIHVIAYLQQRGPDTPSHEDWVRRGVVECILLSEKYRGIQPEWLATLKPYDTLTEELLHM